MTLENLEINKVGIIKELKINNKNKRRFLDLGLIKGTKVKPIINSLSNSLKAYEIRNCLIAIRKEDANNIEIFVE